MEHKTIYVCTGGCNGVSSMMKNCGAPNCQNYDKPLESRVQCDACAVAANRDQKAHACPSCLTA